MPKYKLRFFIQTSLNSAEDAEFTYDGHRVVLLFSQRRDQRGIEAEVCCEGDTWRNAMVLATDALIPPVLDLLAFHRKASMTLTILTSALKSEPGQDRRRVVLISERVLPLAWNIDRRTVEEVNACLAQETDVPSNAMRWLRWAYRSLPIYEWFVYAWLALENLAGSRTVEKRCPKCGHNLQPHPAADREAAYEIVNSVGDGVPLKEFREWWYDLRNSVFHGGKRPDAEFLGKLRSVTPRIIDAVEAAVQKRLNVNPEHRPTRVVTPEQTQHVHYFLEFDSDNREEEFASRFPSLERLEELVEKWKPLSEEMNTTLLKENDFESW